MEDGLVTYIIYIYIIPPLRAACFWEFVGDVRKDSRKAEIEEVLIKRKPS